MFTLQTKLYNKGQASSFTPTRHISPLFQSRPSHYIIPFDTVWKTGLPVRSAVLKPHAGELVVGWVTTSESSLLYVLFLHSYTRICLFDWLFWVTPFDKSLD
ncbi:L-lysine 2-3-aminomutase [Penicillium sp. CMV-2018d]|nr:L-lysine 2-3-aminomutase [Penicillium sp. CMV-2018d]